MIFLNKHQDVLGEPKKNETEMRTADVIDPFFVDN